MSIVQILNTFRAYGADVLLLALGVTLTVSLLKKTVMKKVSRKVFVFLPFAVGLVYYAVFRALVTMSAEPFTTELARTFEGGFACGCAATLYYVAYEQFFRGGSSSPLYPLLEGIVPEDKREEAAQTLWEGCRNTDMEQLEEYFEKTLNDFADPPLSRTDLEATAKLLAAYVRSVIGK